MNRVTRAGRTALAIAASWTAIHVTAWAQVVDDVPFRTADELRLEARAFEPLRAEYRHYLPDEEGRRELYGYVFVQLEVGNSWGTPSLVVNWSRSSWHSTGFDTVFTTKHLGTLQRIFPSQGQPGGVVIENHHYRSHVDVLFTNPNLNPEADPEAVLRFPGTPERTFAYNTVYREPKRYAETHNVITWPYVLSSIDWEETSELVMPGFSPFGNVHYYYRLIHLGVEELTDPVGGTHRVKRIAAIRTNSLEESRRVDLRDEIQRAYYLVSERPPYYLGKEVVTRRADGVEELVLAETFVGFETLEHSYNRRLDELLELFGEHVDPTSFHWIRDRR